MATLNKMVTRFYSGFSHQNLFFSKSKEILWVFEINYRQIAFMLYENEFYRKPT
ncbi:hypothetical protein ADICYQ_2405 [Cyclobacterium qasimii M12-11B]|uniref:Uncharacterized protein n=1 Tax=Cyclobacterium qasimii M12-11B TaxID=641524 RepID=S7VGB4_9BACT|nr:hypothetical protein ADICYQ_2405 [Cyclobacterium qasimii M12-11B]